MTSTVFVNVLIAVDGAPATALRLLKRRLLVPGLEYVLDTYEATDLHANLIMEGDAKTLEAEAESVPLPLTRFRLRWKRLGGHIHCRLFQAHADRPGDTWQKNGDVAFDLAGWDVFHAHMVASGVEVVEEAENG
jgi:hypothetical protein